MLKRCLAATNDTTTSFPHIEAPRRRSVGSLGNVPAQIFVSVAFVQAQVSNMPAHTPCRGSQSALGRCLRMSMSACIVAVPEHLSIVQLNWQHSAEMADLC